MSLTKAQPVPRRVDTVAFSSNNPFRASTTSSIYFSPGEEDRDSIFSDRLDPPPVRQIPVRSHSAGSESRPFSFMPTDDRPLSTLSAASSAPSNPSRHTLLIDDSDQPVRRPYNPNRNTVYRKSTNPFLEDMAPESPPAQAPRRPPASSKPSAAAPKPAVAIENKRPPPPPPTRQRRANSDSSVMEAPKTEERRDKERRHRHHRDGKKRSSKKKVHTDTIDKLDVTGFFGAGSFHHDGPFDACNPNRNKNTKRAPVKAFPVDGANMTLNGVGPRDKYATEDNILGRGVDEAYNDYNYGGKPPPSSAKGNLTTFDTSVKNTPVHGDLTWGLGSTTFLDGAPASRDAVKLAEKEAQVAQLGRKKSLVQKLRGGNGPGPAVPRRMEPPTAPIERTASNPSDEVRVPASQQKPEPSAGGGLLRRVKSLKVSGRRRNS